MSNYEAFKHHLLNRDFSIHGEPLASELLVSADGRFKTYYAPFDYVNQNAKIVICGITPGLQQATNALNELRRASRAGERIDVALQLAKEVASFSGAMRNNLIAMLDHVDLNKWLGINTCADLFGASKHLVHCTSALRNPVFLDGKNYSGTPAILRQPALRQQVESVLAAEIRALDPSCVYVPLGGEVSSVFEHLESQGLVKNSQVLHGLPHPSPASNERISYFLGRKDRADLSPKTNAAKIDAGKVSITAKVMALQGI